MRIHDVARFDQKSVPQTLQKTPPRLTGNVGQETKQQVNSIRQADARRRRQGEIHQPGLADQARRVQDDKSAVSVRTCQFSCSVTSLVREAWNSALPKPLQPTRRIVRRQQRHKIPISNHLRNTPEDNTADKRPDTRGALPIIANHNLGEG